MQPYLIYKDNFSYDMYLDAVQRIKKIIENPAASPKLKREYYAQIGVVEVFLEATPTAFLYLNITLYGIHRGNIGTVLDDEGLMSLLIGTSNVQLALFFLSFGSSVFSSAFGVARYIM